MEAGVFWRNRQKAASVGLALSQEENRGSCFKLVINGGKKSGLETIRRPSKQPIPSPAPGTKAPSAPLLTVLTLIASLRVGKFLTAPMALSAALEAIEAIKTSGHRPSPLD